MLLVKIRSNLYIDALFIAEPITTHHKIMLTRQSLSLEAHKESSQYLFELITQHSFSSIQQYGHCSVSMLKMTLSSVRKIPKWNSCWSLVAPTDRLRGVSSQQYMTQQYKTEYSIIKVFKKMVNYCNHERSLSTKKILGCWVQCARLAENR